MIASLKQSHKTVTRKDKDFFFTDSISNVPRASIIITEKCPSMYADMIGEFIMNGWLDVVANVEEKEK